MLRIVIVAASVLLTIGPAVAGDKNHPALDEEIVAGSSLPTSQGLSKAAHNASMNQQTGAETGGTATQMGVSTLFPDQ